MAGRSQSEVGFRGPDAEDQSLASDNDTDYGRREELQSKIQGQIASGKHPYSYALNPQYFEFAHLFRNTLVLHTIPWQSCSPSPALVQKQFNRSVGRAGLVSPIAIQDLYNTVTVFEKSAERPLTNDEVSALAYWSSRKAQTISYYWKGAALLGAFLWWRRRRTFRLPFWTPKDPSRFSTFPHISMPLLQGPSAQRAWMAQRLGIYLFFAAPLGLFVGMSSGTMAQIVGIEHDQRTSDLHNTLRQKVRQQTEERVQGLRRSGTPQAGTDRHPPTRGGQSNLDENGTNGTEMAAGAFTRYTDSSVAADTGLLNDQQMQSRDRRQRNTFSPDPSKESNFSTSNVQGQPRDLGGESTRDPYAFPRETAGDNTRDQYSGSESSASSQSSTFEWDEASSTAQNEKSYDSSSASSESGITSSTWDRLRQNAMTRLQGRTDGDVDGGSNQLSSTHRASRSTSPESSPLQPDQNRESSSGSAWDRARTRNPIRYPQSQQSGSNSESFTFSRDDEERSFAKGQAQKEFDEMIERERRGEGGGGASSM